MASFAAEFCIQESLGYILRHHWADNARPKHQNIHIVVLHALMRGIVIVAQPGADALEFVRGDGNAHAAAANENAALGFPGTEIFSHQNGVIRIIVRFAGLKGSEPRPQGSGFSNPNEKRSNPHPRSSSSSQKAIRPKNLHANRV